MLWIPITILLLAALLLAGGYHFMTLAVYPKVYSSEYVYQAEVERGALAPEEYNRWPRQELSIHSPFGYPLRALYFPIQGSQKTVIISHGITWNLYGMVQYMPMFRKRGFNVLIYDLRNHGRSGGKNTTFGFYEKQDLKAVFDWALAQLGPEGRVGTMGVSLGAVTSIQHAAIDPRVAFVIPDCPFSDLVRLFTCRLRLEYRLPPFPLLNLGNFWSRLLTGMSFGEVSLLDDMQKITAPVFLVHTRQDDYIPCEMALELYEHKQQGYRKLWLAPNGAHAEAYWKNRTEYEQQLGDFLTAIELA